MSRLVRFQNTCRALTLPLPLPTRSKMRIYYGLFTEFFEITTERSGIINYGQEALCRDTVATLPRTGKWLDVGCGVGGPACLLARENPQVEITGINITPAQIEQATERAASMGLSERVRFQYGDACRMSFDGAALFDGLYAIETAFHFADKEAFVREAHRVLKPGGRFACADLVLEPTTGSKLNRVLTKMFHKIIGTLNVQSMYSVEDWRRAFAKAGFSEFAVRDITEVALRDGMAAMNQQMVKNRHLLDEKYPSFLTNTVYRLNEQIINNVHSQPMRYVLITARA